MAEINSLLSAKAEKQQKAYETFLKETVENYEKLNTAQTKLAKSLLALNTKTKAAAKNQESLDKVTVERNKLLKTQETLTAKQNASLDELTKQNIKLKEAEKKRLAILKEEVTGEKAAAEAKKKAIIVAKEKEKAAKLAIATSKKEAAASQKLKIQTEKATAKAKEQSRAYVILTNKHTIAVKKAKDLAAAYGVNSSQARKATTAANKYGKQLEKINSNLGQHQSKVGGYFGAIVKGAVASAVAFVGFRTVFNVFKNSLKTIASFEEGMSKVKAVAGASVSQFKALTANAKLLGATTSRTATEVAGLQLEFSKLGFGTKEILQATEATISLSIAAGSDLAESAVVAASTVRGFGLNASETQRVVDVMAKSFASSALDMSKFKVAMATAAPVAKAMGKGIEFTTAQLSVLSDAGLDASTAGTSLRNMFLELTKKGLTWEEGLAQIQNSTDKAATGLALFGKRGVTAGLILADNTAKAAKLEKSYLNSAGAAEKMAKIMEDNLIGDTKKLSSAWEGWILKSEKGITNLSRKIVQFATKVLVKLNGETEKQIDLRRIDTREMDASFNALKNVNLSQDARLKLIDDINKEYGEYLPNLLDENSTIEDITKAQIASNKAFKTKIIQQAFQKELTALVQKELEAQESIAQSQIDRAKANDLLITSTDAGEKAVLDQSKLVADLNESLATSQVANNEKEVNDTKEKFRRIAELYNIAFSEIENAINTSSVIIEENEDETTANRIENIDNILIAEKEFADNSLTITKDITDKRKEQYDKDLEFAKYTAEAKIELNKQVRESAISAAQETGNILFDLAQSQRDSELEGLEEGSARRKELLTEQAQSERNQALFNVAINSATGIIKTISNVGLPTAFPLLAIQAALAATQIAAIASQPIPEFFRGTTDTPYTFTAGEKGSELMIKKDGSVELTPDTKTIYSGKEYQHAQIVPNEPTKSILRKTKTNDNKELVNEMRLTRRAIENSNTNIHFSRNVGKLNKTYFKARYKKDLN